MNGKKWEEWEINLLREKYPDGGIVEIKRLTGRSDDSVRKKAKSLGLRNEMHFISDYDDFIRGNYKKMTAREISMSIGHTERSIQKYCARKGYSKKWTDENLIYLENKYGQIDTKIIAKKLGRTENAVILKACELGIGGVTMASDKLNCSQVAFLVGKKRKKVSEWCRKSGLKSKKLNCYRMIAEDDLFKWMQENPHRWSARDCDYHFFARHPWFQEKLKKENEERRKIRWGEA